MIRNPEGKHSHCPVFGLQVITLASMGQVYQACPYLRRPSKFWKSLRVQYFMRYLVWGGGSQKDWSLFVAGADTWQSSWRGFFSSLLWSGIGCLGRIAPSWIYRFKSCSNAFCPHGPLFLPGCRCCGVLRTSPLMYQKSATERQVKES